MSSLSFNESWCKDSMEEACFFVLFFSSVVPVRVVHAGLFFFFLFLSFFLSFFFSRKAVEHHALQKSCEIFHPS